MAADFKVYANPQGATPRFCKIASATVIEDGDAIGIASGLVVKANASTASIGIAAAPSANGETTDIPVWTDPSIIFSGTADANFAAANRSTIVDLVMSGANQLIDIGASDTEVFTVEPGGNAGTIGSPANVLVRINKPI